MRQLKTVLLVVAITFSSVLMASTNPEDRKTESAITDQVANLLKNPKFILEKEVVASVKITLNKNNELVVLSVDSQEEYISNFIKTRLNYTALPVAVNGKQKTFIVPVRVIPEE